MDDLISRQAALDVLNELARDRFTIKDTFQIYLDALKDADLKIRQMPTADLSEYCDKLWKEAYERGKRDAQPRKGKWMEKGGDTICPFCGFSCNDIYYLHEGNYCPDCGAKLEWEE